MQRTNKIIYECNKPIGSARQFSYSNNKPIGSAQQFILATAIIKFK